jgi:hypothetical protein
LGGFNDQGQMTSQPYSNFDLTGLFNQGNLGPGFSGNFSQPPTTTYGEWQDYGGGF